MDGGLSKIRRLPFGASRSRAVSISPLRPWVGMALTWLIAWGDVDALAEAGFCYAQGVGCKKDLKKSAQFYRKAEAKGMSMVGNSW